MIPKKIKYIDVRNRNRELPVERKRYILRAKKSSVVVLPRRFRDKNTPDIYQAKSLKKKSRLREVWRDISEHSRDLVGRVVPRWARVYKVAIFVFICGGLFIFFGKSHNILESATYQWIQSSWTGASTSPIVHPAPTGWEFFESADSHVVLGDSVSADYALYNLEQTSDADFSLGVFDDLEMEGVGEDAYIQLSKRIATAETKWSAIADIPASVGYGGHGVAVGDDTIYVLRGNTTSTFYEYTISTNTWVAKANFPITLNALPTSMAYPGSGDFVYVVVQAGVNNFYRYSLSENTWTILENYPAVGYNATSLTYPGSGDYLYALRGGSGDGPGQFYRYSLSQNVWTSLADAPEVFSEGASMTSPGSGDYLYVVQGGLGTGFFRYSISANSWSSLADVPGIIGEGGSILHPRSGDYIYATRGLGTNDFYRYSITRNVWESLMNASYSASFGGNLIYTGSGDVMYALRGGSSVYMDAYSLSGNSWSPPARLPTSVYRGGALVYPNSGDYLYAFVGSTGSNPNDFYRYSFSENVWSALPNPPERISAGATLAYPGSGDFIYAFRGNTTTSFYRYSISQNVWSALAPAPANIVNGASLISPGSGDFMYATSGAGTNGFYRYSISGNAWVTLSNTPFVGASSLVAPEGLGYIYAYSGSATYRYSLASATWSGSIATPPGGSAAGTSMMYPGFGDYLYAFRGFPHRSFYRFSLSQLVWETLQNAPDTIGDGSAMLYPGFGNYIYALRGGYRTDMYRFPLYSFVPSASFVSPAIDTGRIVPAWGSATWDWSYSDERFQFAEIKVRSSATSDFGVAPDWASCSPIISGSPLTAGGCVTSGHRYLQYRVVLSTLNSEQSPMFHSVTLGYSAFPESSALISTPFDASDDTNVMKSITWEENASLPSGSQVTLSLRSATNQALLEGSTWSVFTASSPQCAKSGVLVTCGSDAMPSVLKDGAGERWFQYKIDLGSGGDTIAEVGEVRIEYVVNAPPQVRNVVAVARDDKTVSITYEVRDPDATSGTSTPNEVTPSFEYWNGTSWSPITALATGDEDNKTVEESAFREYSATWTPFVDVPERYFPGSAKIRVIVSDNEAANSGGYAESSLYTLDTKTPQDLTFFVDASTTQDPEDSTPALVSLGATDDSPLKMKVSLLPDLSDVAWTNFSATAEIDLESDPDTVYAKLKDIYGNETDVFSVTTPETPSRLMVQDTSNVLLDPAEYRLFVGFKALTALPSGFGSYKVYRSDDGTNYSLLNTFTNQNNNFFTDSSVEYNATYHYYVKTVDGEGNTSFLSSSISGKANGAQDSGEGGGGSETTPPVISDVSVTSVDTTSAVITWDTDELSTSTIEYSTSPGIFTNQTGSSMYADSSDRSGEHRVVMTNLLPDVTYYFRVTSTDPLGNASVSSNGGSGYSFTTLPGPTISGVTVVALSNERASIVWNTNVTSDSRVSYSQTFSNGELTGDVFLIGSGVLTRNHSVELENLVPGTKYFFKVSSTDAMGNIATENNGGVFFEFITTVDETPPVIDSIETPVLSDAKAVIAWHTNEPATSQVSFWNKDLEEEVMTTQEVSLYNESHYIILSELTADTAYEFRVTSRDINGLSTTSDISSFRTQRGSEYNHGPLTKISEISDPPGIVTDQNAVITFRTDESAQCVVEFGTQPGEYGETPVGEASYNKDHAIQLGGLIFSTTYYYRISCSDNLDNVVVSDEYSFVTKVRPVVDEEDGAGAGVGDKKTEALNVSGASISNVTGESATVSWKTDRNSNSMVRFGVTEEYGNMTGDDVVNVDPELFTTDHTVVLRGLIPSTKYHVVALSADIAGNVGASANMTFTTKDPSSISAIKSLSEKIGEVTITWKTSQPISTIVEYGVDQVYSQKKEDKALTEEHSVTLSGLSQNTTYHFRVKGFDKDGNLYASSDYTFEPKSPPLIRDVSAKILSYREVEVLFVTDIPTDSVVAYTNVSDEQDAGSQGTPLLTQTHSVRLKDLTPGATYRATVFVRDDSGNETRADVAEFTLEKDDVAPEISQVKTDAALAQNGKVQMIISWGTDEPSESWLQYREQSTGEEKEVVVSSAHTESHVAVLTSFKSGSLYAFNVRARDVFGNETISKEYITLTPRVKENVIELITKNFKDIFSWAN